MTATQALTEFLCAPRNIGPCPFCEGEDTHLCDDDERHVIFVSCDRCGAHGPEVEVTGAGSPSMLASATALLLWNASRHVGRS